MFYFKVGYYANVAPKSAPENHRLPRKKTCVLAADSMDAAWKIANERWGKNLVSVSFDAREQPGYISSVN